MTIKEAFEKVKAACGHNKHVGIDVSLSRFRTGRDDIEFTVYDSENGGHFLGPTLEIALEKYLLAIASEKAKTLTEDLDKALADLSMNDKHGVNFNVDKWMS